MKIQHTILAALSILLTGTSLGVETNPWQQYWKQYKGDPLPARSPSNEDVFGGITIKGVYGTAQDDEDPDIGGAMLSLSVSKRMETVTHEFSITTGLMGGSKEYGDYETGSLLGYSPREVDYIKEYYGINSAKTKARLESCVPILIGYEANFHLGDSDSTFYLGGKAGVSVYDLNASIYLDNEKYTSKTESFTDFTFCFGTGFKIALSDYVRLVLGYEYMNIDSSGFHCVQAGLNFVF